MQAGPSTVNTSCPELCIHDNNDVTIQSNSPCERTGQTRTRKVTRENQAPYSIKQHLSSRHCPLCDKRLLKSLLSEEQSWITTECKHRVCKPCIRLQTEVSLLKKENVTCPRCDQIQTPAVIALYKTFNLPSRPITSPPQGEENTVTARATEPTEGMGSAGNGGTSFYKEKLKYVISTTQNIAAIYCTGQNVYKHFGLPGLGVVSTYYLFRYLYSSTP